MKNVKDYINRLIKSLNYIISQDHSNSDDPSDLFNECENIKEKLDEQFHRCGRRSYIVFTKGKFYTICPYTTINDAKFVMENIEEIEYVYDYDYGTDTLIGNTREFFTQNKIPEYKYIQFVSIQNELFTIEDVYSYFNLKKG